MKRFLIETFEAEPHGLKVSEPSRYA